MKPAAVKGLRAFSFSAVPRRKNTALSPLLIILEMWMPGKPGIATLHVNTFGLYLQQYKMNL
ncbi:MAG: hypothetical protein WBN83_13585 [Desulfoprunum sp.]|jgi:hypothetical protein|uniref:hypothetical protein n=1 Tax=Desulfoprunum sp. TaxID=2020866 RepID=UPI000A68DAA9